MKLPLTDFQKQVYDFIEDFIGQHQYPPLYCEIQEQLKVKNPGSVCKAVQALEKKGWVKRNKGLHRGIHLQKGVEQ